MNKRTKTLKSWIARKNWTIAKGTKVWERKEQEDHELEQSNYNRKTKRLKKKKTKRLGGWKKKKQEDTRVRGTKRLWDWEKTNKKIRILKKKGTREPQSCERNKRKD